MRTKNKKCQRESVRRLPGVRRAAEAVHHAELPALLRAPHRVLGGVRGTNRSFGPRLFEVRR